MTPATFIYCRPRGGLNDALCQMAQCHRYAQKHNRQLFINTDRSGLRDDFSVYFHPITPTISFGSHADFKKQIARSTDIHTLPLERYPNVSLDYQSTRKASCWIDRKTGAPLAFDFSKAYKAHILIHEQHGGGTGIEFLQQLQLQPTIAAIIRQHIKTLGHYNAVHIRNTDYQTDYKPQLEQIIPTAKRPIVICTDDHNAQAHAIETYGQKIRLTRPVPDVSAMHIRTLHDNTELNRYDINLSTLIDLFALASARKLHITRLKNGQQAHTSGFLTLARSLRKQKHILIQLLYGQNLTPKQKTIHHAYSIMQAINNSLKTLRKKTNPIRRKFQL